MKHRNFSMPSNRRLALPNILTSLFLALCFFFFLSSHLNLITIEIQLDAAKPGLMQVFWPTPENNYSSTQFKNIRFPAGVSSQKIKIPSFNNKLNLRIDPDNKNNRIKIKHISFSMADSKTTISRGQLGDYIVDAIELKWHSAPDSLILELESNDSKLILSNLPFPSSSFMIWLGPVLILAFRFLIPANQYTNALSSTGRSAYIVIVLFLLLHLLGLSKLEGSLLQSLIINILGALAIVLASYNLEYLWKKSTRFELAGSISLIAIFITLTLGVMSNSLTPELFQLIKNNASTAFNESKSKGLREALLAAREEIEKTYTENVYGNKTLLSINSESKIFVLGFSPSDKAIIGKDNWFFEGYGGRRVEKNITRSFDNITDYMGQNPFTTTELEQWRIVLEERYYWLKERGIDYIFALAPTKALVYPEKLPERIFSMKRKLNRQTRYDQLIKYLEEKSVVPMVDLQTALLNAKNQNTELPLYYRTDFHWNYYGSLVAYQAIIDGINKAYPEYDLVSAKLDDFDVRKKQAGFILVS